MESHSVELSSDHPEILEVSADGTVRCMDDGTATISVHAGRIASSSVIQCRLIRKLQVIPDYAVLVLRQEECDFGRCSEEQKSFGEGHIFDTTGSSFCEEAWNDNRESARLPVKIIPLDKDNRRVTDVSWTVKVDSPDVVTWEEQEVVGTAVGRAVVTFRYEDVESTATIDVVECVYSNRTFNRWSEHPYERSTASQLDLASGDYLVDFGLYTRPLLSLRTTPNPNRPPDDRLVLTWSTDECDPAVLDRATYRCFERRYHCCTLE